MRDQDTKFRLSRFQLLLMLFAFTCLSINAATAQEVRELSEYIKSNEIQPSDPFMDLRHGSAGIIEISERNIVFPKNPNAKNLIVKSSDLGSLPSESGKFGSVQFMQINQETGTFSLNYNQLGSFPALRFILIVSSSLLSETQISQMLPGFEESGIVILYQISRPG